MNTFFARVISGLIPFRKLRHKIRNRLIPAKKENLRKENSIADQVLEQLNALMRLVQQNQEHMTALATQIQGHQTALTAQIKTSQAMLAAQTQGNQIMLASSCGDKYLSIAGSHAPRLCLHTTDSGELCLTPPSSENTQQPPVVIMTIPKSGTHLMAKILDNLGYQDAQFYIFTNYSDRSDVIVDYRSAVDIESRTIFLKSDNSVSVPLDVSLTLVQQGQYVMGHILFDSSYGFGKLREMRNIHMIRDLRMMLVSAMRWDRKLQPNSYPSLEKGNLEECMLLFLANHAAHYLESAKSAVIWLSRQEIPTIRYEDLCSPDQEKRKTCARIVAEVTDCELSSVASAIERAVGAPTATKMDTPSALAGYWTEKVEDSYVASGYGGLNEQLGYVEQWSFD